MITILALYLVGLAAFVGVYVMRQYLRGEHDLISIRNVALLGFVVFQLTGGAMVLRSGPGRTEFIVQDPINVGLIYAAMATVFLIVFLFSYEKGFIVRNLAPRVPVTYAVPGTTMLWMLAVAFIGVCIVLRFGQYPLGFHQLAGVIGRASGIIAVGIVGWIWGPRLLNPVVIVCSLVLISIALFITIGAFGRRPLVALAGALFWGMYFSHMRYRDPKIVLPQLAVYSILPIIAIAMFTSARHGGEKDRTAIETFQEIRAEGSVRDGMNRLIGGQDAAGNSMWLIEQYDLGRFETRPLFTAGYLIVYSVPRHLWEGKPEPLSTHLPHMAMLTRVSRDRLTLGPGIIGHAAAEGGWFALLFYAFFGGLMIRFFDEIVQQHVHNPMVVLPFGTALGHVLGMPRGETAAFTALFILSVVGVYVIMLTFGILIQKLYSQAQMTYVGPETGDEPDADESWPETEYGQYDYDLDPHRSARGQAG